MIDDDINTNLVINGESFETRPHSMKYSVNGKMVQSSPGPIECLRSDCDHSEKFIYECRISCGVGYFVVNLKLDQTKCKRCMFEFRKLPGFQFEITALDEIKHNGFYEIEYEIIDGNPSLKMNEVFK